MKPYFFRTKLADGRYVNLVYESDHKRGTWNHLSDLFFAIHDNGITLDRSHELFRDKHWRDNFTFIYLLNAKNMDEELFDEYETIDVRQQQERR